MLKSELIKKIAERSNEYGDVRYSQKDVETILNMYADTVIAVLKEDKSEKAVLPGLGAFTAKHMNERSGKSSLEGGGDWTKPAYDKLCFTVSKTVREL